MTLCLEPPLLPFKYTDSGVNPEGASNEIRHGEVFPANETSLNPRTDTLPAETI